MKGHPNCSVCFVNNYQPTTKTMDTHKKTNGRIRMRGIKVKSGIKERSEWIDAMEIRRAFEKFFASRGLDRNGY